MGKWNYKSLVAGIIIGTVLTSSVGYAAVELAVKPDMEKPLTFYFDGVPKSPPQQTQGFLYKNTAYVPARFVAENMGKPVVYDGKSLSIFIGKLPVSKTYSKYQAVELVRQKYGHLVPSHFTVAYSHDDESGNYVIHIFEEVVNNFQTGDSYVNSFGWYIVNPNSGIIKPLFD
ncbi:copper amine oxidase N-terminal domain-containing protein [Brevibacillus daliensis]|uniref:copper amine oxidase N-terminal domain-containing protein n=1 Tax=Brevibacillus daliensis TaxID=2892995 RepID=UPI001E531542|nr:copper amine oxidase N-terminal domain-containing protein [Brevibacillus daliensis]